MGVDGSAMCKTDDDCPLTVLIKYLSLKLEVPRQKLTFFAHFSMVANKIVMVHLSGNRRKIVSADQLPSQAHFPWRM